MTGFYRTGCCETGPDDFGVHTICCVGDQAFLAASKALGAREQVDATPTFLLGPTGGTLPVFSPSDLTTASFTGAIDTLLRGR